MEFLFLGEQIELNPTEGWLKAWLDRKRVGPLKGRLKNTLRSWVLFLRSWVGKKERKLRKSKRHRPVSRSLALRGPLRGTCELGQGHAQHPL